MRSHAPWLVLGFVLMASCAAEPTRNTTGAEAPEPDPPTDTLLDPNVPIVLAFGDSLTAGHDVDRALSYPSQLEDTLKARGYNYQVVNYGNDGDTTAQGLARLDGALGLKPEIVILEFGGNDGLQGRSLTSMRENLTTMIQAFRAIGSQVVLAGISLPRNYGPDFIKNFESIYHELALEHDVALIPFLLEGLVDLEALDSGRGTVADSVRYMQSDGTHPTGEGYTIVAETVFAAIEPHLSR